MTAASRRLQPARQAWWLLCDSNDVCTICGHAFACGTESRCSSCDGPICTVCVTVELHCGGCA
ncbi:MAG TPA: hypothetical protein VEC57_11950 [Candidatus Limnocylindrales bacterium]|nr:hypothetical protein [Candidatus Limnocylindrales bacterium]